MTIFKTDRAQRREEQLATLKARADRGELSREEYRSKVDRVISETREPTQKDKPRLDPELKSVRRAVAVHESGHKFMYAHFGIDTSVLVAPQTGQGLTLLDNYREGAEATALSPDERMIVALAGTAAATVIDGAERMDFEAMQYDEDLCGDFANADAALTDKLGREPTWDERGDEFGAAFDAAVKILSRHAGDPLRKLIGEVQIGKHAPEARTMKLYEQHLAQTGFGQEDPANDRVWLGKTVMERVFEVGRRADPESAGAAMRIYAGRIVVKIEGEVAAKYGPDFLDNPPSFVAVEHDGEQYQWSVWTKPAEPDGTYTRRDGIEGYTRDYWYDWQLEDGSGVRGFK